MRNMVASTIVLGLFLGGCASPWKIHGGPKECSQMCSSWGMELTGMVGVGNQDRTGYGATACVCELPRPAAPASTSGAAVSRGAVGTATGTAAVVVALEEARRQEEQHQQQQRRPR
jgi:hypothetical protein